MAGEEEEHQKREPWIELEAESRRRGQCWHRYISRHEFLYYILPFLVLAPSLLLFCLVRLFTYTNRFAVMPWQPRYVCTFDLMAIHVAIFVLLLISVARLTLMYPLSLRAACQQYTPLLNPCHYPSR
ncbi:hypothetical protein J3F84DRAFT_171122 [Trichoderma pleuroticola]